MALKVTDNRQTCCGRFATPVLIAVRTAVYKLCNTALAVSQLMSGLCQVVVSDGVDIHVYRTCLVPWCESVA